MSAIVRPTDIAIQRESGVMQITWTDSTVSEYPLRWLRANCPCATCKEVRREANASTDMLMLNTTIVVEPSTEVARGEVVGNYAIRLEWTDGHGTGIFSYASLRVSADLEKLKPDGAPLLNFEFG